jgi:hypothetical protein
VCGSANNTTVTSQPTSTTLCSQGDYTWIDQTATDGAYNWTCKGSNGGTTANCSASKSQPAVNGVCGSANNTTVTSQPTSTTLCSQGDYTWIDQTATDGVYNWTCKGSNGGITASCSATKQATKVNGACGTANGKEFSSEPTTNLCSEGTESPVKGS